MSAHRKISDTTDCYTFVILIHETIDERAPRMGDFDYKCVSLATNVQALQTNNLISVDKWSIKTDCTFSRNHVKYSSR